MNYRDLEAVRQIIDNATGLEISYAYDDLVFPDNTAFIIQFDENDNNNLFCYFHEDCNPADIEGIFSKLESECVKKSCTIAIEGAFKLEQLDENVKIHFLKNASV